ncbi:Hypothetical predicted protein [Podarcis lilfordi]|nr:Hypothetical predicted protein [Podarcis lilfordi]
MLQSLCYRRRRRKEYRTTVFSGAGLMTPQQGNVYRIGQIRTSCSLSNSSPKKHDGKSFYHRFLK